VLTFTNQTVALGAAKVQFEPNLADFPQSREWQFMRKNSACLMIQHVMFAAAR
jgi:hypothetical protein